MWTPGRAGRKPRGPDGPLFRVLALRGLTSDEKRTDAFLPIGPPPEDAVPRLIRRVQTASIHGKKPY